MIDRTAQMRALNDDSSRLEKFFAKIHISSSESNELLEAEKIARNIPGANVALDDGITISFDSRLAYESFKRQLSSTIELDSSMGSGRSEFWGG